MPFAPFETVTMTIYDDNDSISGPRGSSFHSTMNRLVAKNIVISQLDEPTCFRYFVKKRKKTEEKKEDINNKMSWIFIQISHFAHAISKGIVIQAEQ